MSDVRSLGLPLPEYLTDHLRALARLRRQSPGGGFEADVIEVGAAEIGRLREANAALLAACRRALDVLGRAEINDANRHDPETAEAFDVVLHLAAAIAQAEGRGGSRER